MTVTCPTCHAPASMPCHDINPACIFQETMPTMQHIYQIRATVHPERARLARWLAEYAAALRAEVKHCWPDAEPTA